MILNKKEESEGVVRAFVLVEADVGKERLTIEAIRALHHPNVQVVSVDTVTGPFDVIAELVAKDLDNLVDFVTGFVQCIWGVRRTTTCLA